MDRPEGRAGAVCLRDGLGRADGARRPLENWKEPQSGEWLRSFTILIGAPNGLVAQLHNRMPVIVPEESWERWLSGEDATDIMMPIAAERMQMWPVSKEVNNSRNEGAQLFEPVTV